MQLDSARIAQTKKTIKNGSATVATMQVYKKLLKDADKIIPRPNPTIIDKPEAAPSGDLHDYLSLSRYWWPDPNKKDGLPWIKKDGETNPQTQTENQDKNRFETVCKSVKILSLAYYFSDNEAYAKKASEILRTWFLDPATRMNPNLEYAQSVPGIYKQRPTGILDGRSISNWVLDAVVLIDHSPSWTAADKSQMNEWLSKLFVWLTESKTGQAGIEQTNNHGSWYKFQVASLASYLGKKDWVARMADRAKLDMETQIESNGAQPEELARTKSFFYSCFNLEALSRLAVVAQKNGIDLWNYKTPKGKSIGLGLDYLLPTANGGKWPHASKSVDIEELIPILARISGNTTNKEYENTLQKMITKIVDKQIDSKLTPAIYSEYLLVN